MSLESLLIKANRIITRLSAAVFPMNRTLMLIGVVLGICIRWLRNQRRKRSSALKGKTVVINGVQSGIGMYTAFELGARGATVVVVDCSDSCSSACANIIDSRNGRAFCFSCDTSDEKMIQDRLVTPLKRLLHEKQIGPVELIIDVNVRPPCDAQLSPPLHKLPIDSIRREFDVAAMGHFTVIKAFLSDMVESNRGCVAIVSSSAAVTGVANQVHFCANQFAAMGLTEALRVELREYGNIGVSVFWACVHLNMIDPIYHGESFLSQSSCPRLRLQQAARDIVNGICEGQGTIYIPRYLRYIPSLRLISSATVFHSICAALGLSGGHNLLSNLQD
uniref:Uncharacterized protein n=1 Tax=Spongospora subterranea TaxID=70186 RepID=A0A0H5R9H4_9EUKA|eukprot:CRZ10327.1 hypothetical protein [Spongospora subterranea]